LWLTININHNNWYKIR